MMMKLAHWLKWGAWMLPIVALSACAARSKLDTGAPLAPLQVPQPQAPGSYVLQVGDTISVKFLKSPEFNEDVVVRPDGMISLQLVGDVVAAGLSPQTLAADLTQRYDKELVNPRISVIVRQLGTPPVYVGGEVGHPGIVPLTSGLTLFQAIQAAGGLSVTAHRKQVILIRKGVDGRPAGHSIDVRPIASGEHPETDVVLGPYDVVFVPTSKIADVDIFVDQHLQKLIPRVPFAIAP
ncbi:MAG: polysaccharide biosynthesis/export family protein [Candidatus Binatia bacterium]|jgi:protein involved in polysaccharide export with SLBB domain